MASNAIKFTSFIREIRLHLCQTSPASKGVRDFIRNQYSAIKQENPAIPIRVKECSGIEPKIYARFEKGRETSLPLTNYTEEQVLKTVQGFAEMKPKGV